MMGSIARYALFLLVIGATGCGEKPPPTQAKGGESAIDGNAMVSDVEAKLLASSALRIVIESDATGAVEAHMKTTLTLAPTDKVRLESEGTFQKEPLSLVLTSDGLVMRRKKNGEESEAVPSTGLRRQMLVELVRMGALHDIALLAEGKYPDHLTDAETWVVTHDAKVGPIDATFEPPARPIGFLVRVSGEETGDCTLHVDKPMRPVQRLQVVHFPAGDMRVKETYAFEAVPPDVDYFKP
jgi:hypothetical protein